LSLKYFIKVVDNVIVTVTAKEGVQASKPLKTPKQNKKGKGVKLPPKGKKQRDYSNELLDDSFDNDDDGAFE